MDAKVLEEVKRVTKGVILLDLLVIIILLGTSNFNKPMFTGLLFGTIFSILNFRLLALSLNKAVNLSSNKAQIYTVSRYFIRLLLTALVVFISAKATYINIIGTIIGLTAPTIVILATNLLFIKNKIRRKEA